MTTDDQYEPSEEISAGEAPAGQAEMHFQRQRGGSRRTVAVAALLALVIGGGGGGYYYYSSMTDEPLAVSPPGDMATTDVPPIDIATVDPVIGNPEELLQTGEVIPQAPPMPGEPPPNDVAVPDNFAIDAAPPADPAVDPVMAGGTDPALLVSGTTLPQPAADHPMRLKSKSFNERVLQMQKEKPALDKLLEVELKMMELDEVFMRAVLSDVEYDGHLQALETVLNDPAITNDTIQPWLDRKITPVDKEAVAAADSVTVAVDPVLPTDPVVTPATGETPPADAEMKLAEPLVPVTPAETVVSALPTTDPQQAIIPQGAPPSADPAVPVPSVAPIVAQGGTEAEKAIVSNAPPVQQPLPQPQGTTAGQPMPMPQGTTGEDPLAAFPYVDGPPSEDAVIRPLPKEYLVMKKESGAGDFDSRLGTARIALSQNRHQASLMLFNELYTSHPKDSRVLMGRAVSLQKLGQVGEAMAAYEEVLIADPKNIEALTNMLGLLKVEDPDLAVEKLEELQRVYPYNADIAAQLGFAYAGAANYPAALKYLDLADALNPGNAFVLYNRGVLYDRLGRKAEAAAIYMQILRAHSDGRLEQQLPIESIRRRMSEIN